MSNLVDHARKELALLGEEPDTIDWFCRVVEEFASYGHSGGSASVCIPMLNELLQFKNLTPLTDNPDEWLYHGPDYGGPIWQNIRNSEAFSKDGGKTYYLLSERVTRSWKNLWLQVTPYHDSIGRDGGDEFQERSRTPH